MLAHNELMLCLLELLGYSRPYIVLQLADAAPAHACSNRHGADINAAPGSLLEALPLLSSVEFVKL